MLRSRAGFLLGAPLVAALTLPSTAQAEDLLSPISLGAWVNRDVQASTLGFGMGPHEDGVDLLFFGRAVVGPTLRAGMGGVSGGFAFVEREHVHFGVRAGVSVGGGRIRDAKAGLLANVEPGLLVRFVSEKIGVIHLDAAWVQPLYIPKGGVKGAAMLSIGWSPFYDR